METQGQKANLSEFPGIEVPVEQFGRIAPKSMLNNFNLVATPSQEYLLFAQSGYNASQFTRTALNGDHDPQAEEKKKEEEKFRRQMYATGMKTFSDLTYNDVIENFESISRQYTETIQRNLDAIRVDDSMIARGTNGKPIETVEDLKALQDEKGMCIDQLSIDQTTIVDGVRVNSAAYMYTAHVNEVILDEQLMIEEYKRQVETGEKPIEDLPPEIQEQLVEAENNGGTIPMEEPTVLDILKTAEEIGMTGQDLANAGFLRASTVSVNNVTYDDSTKPFLASPALTPNGP